MNGGELIDISIVPTKNLSKADMILIEIRLLLIDIIKERLEIPWIHFLSIIYTLSLSLLLSFIFINVENQENSKSAILQLFSFIRIMQSAGVFYSTYSAFTTDRKLRLDGLDPTLKGKIIFSPFPIFLVRVLSFFVF